MNHLISSEFTKGKALLSDAFGPLNRGGAGMRAEPKVPGRRNKQQCIPLHLMGFTSFEPARREKNKNKGCVSHCGLAICIKKYQQKKNHGNSNISPCTNITFKKSCKRNQNPSRYYNSIITNLKFIVSLDPIEPSMTRLGRFFIYSLTKLHKIWWTSQYGSFFSFCHVDVGVIFKNVV